MLKAEFDTQRPWFMTVTLLADLGFLGANKDYGAHADIHLPHKKPRKSKNNSSPELTKAQKYENRAHSQKRIVVEHRSEG